MKILMIAPQPFFEPRGTPISVYQRLHGLSALGHQVDLVTYHMGEDVEIPGVEIHRTPRIPLVEKVRVGPSWIKVPLDLLLFLKVLWMLFTKRYDVIHSHEEAAFFSVILSAVFQRPHLYDMHSSLPKQLLNFDFCNYRPVVKLFEIVEKWVLKTCHVVLTIGRDLEEHVLCIYPQANHIRIENIPIHTSIASEGASVAELKQALELSGKLTVVYTGTFERYQGLGLLFESAQIVVEDDPKVVFVMVGGQSEQVGRWQNEVEKLGLRDNVVFVGTVPLEEALKYLALADILVSPRTEGLSVPLKIYSYLHSGKPAVVTDIFAHTQILDEETAVITDVEPEAFAEGILKLIKDAPLRTEIGERAQAYAKAEYSEKSYLLKLERACLAIEHSKHVNEIAQSELAGERILRFP